MNIALIIGCARSGTSILGELLAAHPQVKYVWEAHHIWEHGGMGENQSHRLTEEHATPEVIRTTREWFAEQQRSAPWVVEKCPRNTLRVPYLKRIFPECKIIHIIRDGRDVTCSLLPGIGGAEWSHLRPPTWKDIRREEGVRRCAMAWREVMRIVLQDLAGVSHSAVKYEDLVAKPRAVAEHLLEYLNLPEDKRVADFCTKIQNATHGSYQAENQTMWYRDDHEVRIGRWKDNLTVEQQRVVQAILADTLVELGYSLPSSSREAPT